MKKNNKSLSEKYSIGKEAKDLIKSLKRAIKYKEGSVSYITEYERFSDLKSPNPKREIKQSILHVNLNSFMLEDVTPEKLYAILDKTRHDLCATKFLIS